MKKELIEAYKNGFIEGSVSAKMNMNHDVEGMAKSYVYSALQKAKKKESGWISVGDRLPNDYKAVLIHTKGEPDISIVVAIYDSSCNCFLDYDDNTFTATHWQPLPQPPS